MLWIPIAVTAAVAFALALVALLGLWIYRGVIAE